MSKLTRIIIIIIVSVVELAMPGCGGGGDPDYGILRAVPSDAGVVIKASDVCELCTTLDNYNMIWAQLRQMPRLKTASNAIHILDTLSKNNHNIRMSLQGRSAMVSFHKEGRDKVCPLVGVELDANTATTLMLELLNTAKRKKMHYNRTQYDGRDVFEISDGNKNGMSIYMSYVDGVLLASAYKLTTEQAIRHLHSGGSAMAQDKTLRTLLKAAGKNVSAVLIFNHTKLCEMFKSDLSEPALKLARHANWSVLDISLQKQTATCAGYTDVSRAGQQLSVIRSQVPVKIKCPQYLPSKTTSFVTLGISDAHKFENDYTNHLKDSDCYGGYEKNNKNISQKYGVDLATLLYTNVLGCITEFSCTYSLAGRSNDHYVIAELSDPDNFDRQMQAFCMSYRKASKIDDKSGITTITTSIGKSYKVYAFPVKHMFPSYFGKMFDAESSYFMMYRDMAVFGQSPKALYEYANNIDNGKVLASNSIYDGFAEFVTPKCNIYYYLDISYSQEEIRRCLSRANADEITSNFGNIQNIRSLALQYSHADDGSGKSSNIFYTNAAVMHSSTIEADRYVSWLAQTDTTICNKPQIVINHVNKEKEVLVQDETNVLYLFNKNGVKQFSKQVGEPIISPVTQIDYYGNGKLQYVFATEHSLHAIDRNGNYLANFPVTLPAMVATDISVFDYEGNNDYRIFVPCTDKCLYVYTKEGCMLDTWTPMRTNEPLVTPVQYFRIGDNDYLVCADNLKTYILNRRGEVRIKVTNSFAKAKNSLFYLENSGTSDMRFVTSNSSGEIKYIYFDGSCKSKKFGNFTANHYFVFQDIDGDGSAEYIFTDGEMLYVYRADGTEMFSYCCDGSIGRPNIFSFSSKDVRIGITCRSLNKIFLIDNRGKVCSGFPLNGSSEFSISRLNSNSRFSILVGGSDNYLYNYWIY